MPTRKMTTTERKKYNKSVTAAIAAEIKNKNYTNADARRDMARVIARMSKNKGR